MNKRNSSLFQIVAAILVMFGLTGCPMTVPPTADGGVDPLEGTACSPITPAEAIMACDYPCWSVAVRVCPVETRTWTRCTPDEVHGHDTCAPAPCTGPAVCTTPCGNAGLQACDATTGLLGSCTPIAPSLETCDAGVADSGVPSDAGPPDAGPPDAGPPDAGPPACGGCTDPSSTRICATPCGYAGGQTCGECLGGGVCHPLAPSLETCMTDAGPVSSDSGPMSSDAGPVAMDTGTDAPVAMIDSGVDAPMSIDGGTDAPVVVVDAGSDAGPAPVDAGTDAPVAMVDAGSDAGPAPVDAGSDSGPAPVDSGVDSGSVADAGSSGSDSGTSVVLLGGPGLVVVQIGGSDSFLCPSGGVPDIRLFDSSGTLRSSHRARSLVLSQSLFGPGNRINLTIFCQFDTVDESWNGYTSPMVQGQTLNTRVSTTVFTEISVGGRDVRPGSFYCWDTSQPRSLMIERAQFPIVGPTDALPTACYGTTGS